MTCYSKGMFCYLLTFSETRIGNGLIIRDFIRRTFFIVMNCIADRILGPMRIQCDIFCYRLIPVIRRTGIIGSSIPTLEGVICLCRVRGLFCVEAIFIRLSIRSTFMTICRFICIGPGSALHIKRNSTSRKIEGAIQYQPCRHLCILVICIFVFVFAISVPAFPFRAFHRGVRNSIGNTTVNVRI